MLAGCWLSDGARAAIEPLLPKSHPGARRVDDRCVISGIIHVLRIGCRSQDCPPAYGPPTTICNRFNRWSHRGLWVRIFDTLSAQSELPDDLSIDSADVRAHHSAQGGKGGRKRGTKNQVIGRSRGGLTTKIHDLTYGCGWTVALTLSPGDHPDIAKAPPF